MLKLDVKGTLGKFGYSNIPDDIVDQIIGISTLQAYKTAVLKAPWDPEPDGIHIKEDLKFYYSKTLQVGEVWIRSPYANIAEYGSRHRFAHPYMRPASQAARNKMRAVIRASTKAAVDKGKK